jgi:hypothetical protein
MNSRAKVSPPIQPTIPKGTICVRDMRLWHSGMPNFSNNVRIMVGLVYFPAWFGCHMLIILPQDVEVKVKDWKADLVTKTLFRKGPLNYLKNEGKMNAQAPLNFCQDPELSLVAYRTMLDLRDGREPNVMIDVTPDNYWVPKKITIRRKSTRKGAGKRKVVRTESKVIKRAATQKKASN